MIDPCEDNLSVVNLPTVSCTEFNQFLVNKIFVVMHVLARVKTILLVLFPSPVQMHEGNAVPETLRISSFDFFRVISAPFYSQVM